MATRVLPGVYVYLNDLTQLPEGASSLNVGYVVKAERGKVNDWGLMTNPTDFLTKYTFSGQPSEKDDPTFHSILKVLAQTNSMYIVRAANNPLYGGVIIKKSKDYGRIVAVDKEAETITIEGNEVPEVGEILMVTGTGIVDGYYIAKSIDGKVITVTGDILEDYDGSREDGKLFRAPVNPIGNVKVANISGVDVEAKAFILDGNVETRFAKGDKVEVKNSSEVAYASNNGIYTVIDAVFDMEANKTELLVEEAVIEGSDGEVYLNSIVNPDNYIFAEDDLMLITGSDPGAYNGKESFSILSSLDNPDQLVYNKKSFGFDTMQLTVYNAETNEQLETFTFSRDPQARTIDGASLFIDSIVAGSAYIKVINNSASTEVSASTLAGTPIQASGGSNGGEVTDSDLVKALDVFADKTIPISLIGNGCSEQAESPLFQQSLISLAVNRKDCVAFLNSPKKKEIATLPSTRAQDIVNYKKNDLGSTTFYATMYAPHVKTPDVFNSREVVIGSDAVAIAGWLDVINNLNYPYAYAGPRNGLVTGVTTDWKIGDTSGEAELLNDASINYVAYDGKVGRYYMQTQNTLQIANSAMRNLGCVLNVLDIKETLATNLKEYIGLPITDDLRRDIADACNDYLAPMVGTRFYNYSFQDITTNFDIDNDTLRYLLSLSVVRYAQRIYLTMNVVRSNFEFSILQSA